MALFTKRCRNLRARHLERACGRRKISSFGRNSFFNVLDVFFNLANFRMQVTHQIVLGLGKLFNALCHFMQLFQPGAVFAFGLKIGLASDRP
jgi:hypothetical protein